MSYFKGKNKEFSFRDLLYKALIFIGTVGLLSIFCRGTASSTTSSTLTNPGSTDN